MTRPARTDRSESELAVLRKLAIDFATGRKETATTVHLLAAVAARAGCGADLLVERGLDRDTVLKAGRSFSEEVSDAINKTLAEAREIAKRARGSVSTDGERGKAMLSPDSRLALVEPSGLHVLVALLAARSCAAHRALALSGVDVTRLRAIALARASGAVSARRATVSDGKLEVTTPPPSIRRVDAAVVPLLPRTPPARTTPVPPAPMRAEAIATSPTPSPARPAPARPAPPRPAVASPPRRQQKRAAPAESETEAGPERTRTPLIDALCRMAGTRSEPAISGREEDALRALDVLSKHRANAPCLIGPAGVGKTSVARLVTARLAATGARPVEVSTSQLLSGAAARGALAERIAALFDEARRSEEKIVFFFDDVHELLASGEEAVFELKAELARGDVAMLFATSTEAYRRHVEADAQLARRMVPVEIEEPEEAEAFFMVRAASEVLARHHGVTYGDPSVAAAIGWSVRYLAGRALPDKAIGALDLAGARSRRAGGRGGEVSLEAVADVIAELADVPVERLLQNDRERLTGLEAELKKRVVGHTNELSRIASQLKKSAAGLRHQRPLGSFLLLGPTGVGKTETAKAIAEVLFGSPDAMTRLDLSEFAEAHALARLIGAPPGYVGHEAGGQLTEAVKRRPYQVVLLDEIEKAHPEVLLAFLQVLDEGRLTDGRGRKIDFTNVVVVMTSNLGARAIAAERRGSAVGFARSGVESGERLGNVAMDAAKKHLPIELYGRIDEVLFFSPLGRDEVAKVAGRMLDALAAAMDLRGIRLDIEDGVVGAILDAGGFDPELGARPLRRTIARLIEAPLADLILSGDLVSGTVALVGVEGDAVVVDAIVKGSEAPAVRAS